MIPDREHPELLSACMDARTAPEALRLPSCPTIARRAVACRLAHAGWRPGRIAATLGVTVRTVRRWASLCPARFDTRAWRPPAGISDTPMGRKLRRCRDLALPA